MAVVEKVDPLARAPVIEGDHDYGSVTDKISTLVLERRTPATILAAGGAAFLLFMGLLAAIAYLFHKGVGIWGINVPVAWGFAIVNFVWWIGIGHAGTLISAILLLLHQNWRVSINRLAEAMTLFAVACAGLFPILHLGRPQYFYWLLPYPTTMGVWPQFRSPLVWDLFAISTYGTVSLIFWYLGLIPDLASMRDAARRSWVKKTYGILSFGWRGSAAEWSRFQRGYLILAGMATPLVVSVHSVVSLDFTVAALPGWHSTLFPPYFVAGAIFSGFAMVLTIVIPIRRAFGLQDLITARHFDNMAKVLLASGWIVAYSYVVETFVAWYSGNIFEGYIVWDRAFGAYGSLYWIVLFCNVAAIQPLWSRRARTNLVFLWLLSIVINVGMWLERYVIVVQSLHRDYMPGAWGLFSGTFWDWLTLLGSFGLFGSLLFVFLRLAPALSISEARELAAANREASS